MNYTEEDYDIWGDQPICTSCKTPMTNVEPANEFFDGTWTCKTEGCPEVGLFFSIG